MSFEKLQVVNLSTDFAKATKIVEVSLRAPNEGEVLVKNYFAGVNASDIIISAGNFVYDGTMPYDIGYEGLGLIEKVGSKVTDFEVGQCVLYHGMGGYAQYIYATASQLIPVPEMDPKYLSAVVNGLTATIGLDKSGFIKAGEKVLITAAAGGTGQICVQHAKSKGCYVIGTTSTEEKANYLKSIGCDEVINYKKKSISEALSAAHPDGVDVIWETIGGETLVKLVDNLAVRGRMLIVGGITSYKEHGIPTDVTIPGFPLKIVYKSISITGYGYINDTQYYAEYLQHLITRISTNDLKIRVDQGETSPDGPFKGLAGAVRAVQHLHSGKSSGKVVVAIQ